MYQYGYLLSCLPVIKQCTVLCRRVLSDSFAVESFSKMSIERSLSWTLYNKSDEEMASEVDANPNRLIE